MDPYQAPDQQDEAVIEAMSTRLQARGESAKFNAFIDQYLGATDFRNVNKIIDLGCGTGVVTRRIAAHVPDNIEIIGVDLSEKLLAVARPTADSRTSYLCSDASKINSIPNSCAEVIIMHTLLSHVPDPVAILKEAARLLTSRGKVIIFDADYASTTFALDDFEKGCKTDRKLFDAIVHNLDVCRMMPRHIKEAGLSMSETFGNVIVEAGKGDFWHSSVLGFEKLIPALGILPEEKGKEWVAAMLSSHEDGTFFAAGNYYTYIAEHA